MDNERRCGSRGEGAQPGRNGFAFTTSVDEALDLTKFQVIIWTFDFLELYAALAGIIVVGAILLYADTRQRERNLSYALAVRMGLTRREHLTAGFLEFGGLVFLGGALGSFVAYLAARSIYPALDALPSTPPPPQWVGVLDVAVVLGILALIVGLVASHVAQRTADSADVSELLRHGG
jgi:predicted lysophospholipase L1 biosynthesis ABC-type transport system permease subunit